MLCLTLSPQAFRNEISPRSGLLRVREFEMMEIEHFVNPERRQKFDKFGRLADLKVKLFSACNQMDGKPAQEISLRDAVDQVAIHEWSFVLSFYLVPPSPPSLPDYNNNIYIRAIATRVRARTPDQKFYEVYMYVTIGT